MDLTNIKVNRHYTYTGLCLALGEYPQGGQARINQFKKWKKHFEWRTEGSTRDKQFIITKIYAPIETYYKVNDKVFTNKQEAEEYRKSL